MSDKGEGLATLPPVETVAREFVGLFQEAARTLPDAECLPEHTDVWQASDILDRCADRIEALFAKLKLAEAALVGSEQALCDWLNTYASDLCSPVHVEQAEKRIGEHGTIAYIAAALTPVRSALNSIRED